MSVEVLPLGVRCNLSCSYCYQQPMRDADNEGDPRYNMDAMLSSLGAELLDERGVKRWESARFAVFGGEPLLVPVKDLETLWRWGHEKFGVNGIQTNAALLTDEHVELMHRYNVQPGISIDGPDELNDVRSAGSAEATREATRKSCANLERLLQEGLKPSLIVTIHQGNTGPRLERLLDWLRYLSTLGLRYVNVHFLESESPMIRERWGLSDEVAARSIVLIGDLMAETFLRIQPITEITQLLLGRDQDASCVWHACDPYTTNAVRGVMGDGTRANCGRTNKDGVNWVKSDQASYVRQVALYETDQQHGGCSGCRFFFACKGQCPGTAIDNDWRNRTEHCGALKKIFRLVESRLLALGLSPISTDEEKRAHVTNALLSAWRRGDNISIERALGASSCSATRDVPHGDHHDTVNPVITHGDHLDVA